MSSLLEAVALFLENYSTFSSCPKENLKLFFEQAKIPSISMCNYLGHLNLYMHCPEHCYVMALIYVERLISNFKKNIFDNISLHKLFLISLSIAVKFSEDKYCTNSYYAKVGGIPTKDFNNLEQSFLMLLDFNLYISYENYENFIDIIVSTAHSKNRQNYTTKENVHITHEIVLNCAPA
ncbi:unnamed protein product [Blepharisma stoltei]|uniref:Cyclin n=1 Tax=Blepharisma stoltei TaxID=1481888 RepID=A0AAU9JP91_9CILI|nr:unnamed protein product [Blepharisma stoltei]